MRWVQWWFYRPYMIECSERARFYIGVNAHPITAAFWARKAAHFAMLSPKMRRAA